MNLDPDKVKRLVLSFAELDEEYQNQLLAEAFKLELMQSQKNQLKKEDTKYKSKEEFQEAVHKRSNKVAGEAMQLIDIMKKVDDTDKAILFMMVKQLAGEGKSVKESDISITVHQKSISMKEYLNRCIPGADYAKADEKVHEIMDKVVNNKKKDDIAQPPV